MPKAFTLHGSGDFASGTGKWRVVVTGAGDQSEAYDAAAAEAPATYLGVPRGPVSAADQGGGVFLVEFDYPVATVGQPPPPPPGGGGGGPTPNQPVGTDLSFTFGGGTTRIYVSKETKYGIGRNGARAPNYNNLIGYNPKDGSVEGCEVYSRSCDLTVTKRFLSLQYGYLYALFSQVGTTNKKAFRGMYAGECLYVGSDGGYKLGQGGTDLPWEISAKFKFSQNQQEDVRAGDVKIPKGTANGHDYIWYVFQDTDEDTGDGKYKVARPLHGYVERVYDESNFDSLGMD